MKKNYPLLFWAILSLSIFAVSCKKMSPPEPADNFTTVNSQSKVIPSNSFGGDGTSNGGAPDKQLLINTYFSVDGGNTWIQGDGMRARFNNGYCYCLSDDILKPSSSSILSISSFRQNTDLIIEKRPLTINTYDTTFLHVWNYLTLPYMPDWEIQYRFDFISSGWSYPITTNAFMEEMRDGYVCATPVPIMLGASTSQSYYFYSSASHPWTRAIDRFRIIWHDDNQIVTVP